MSSYVSELAFITLLAAMVNGALGYGFSSITVPLALLFLSNRVLNPALVLIEVVLNALRPVGQPRRARRRAGGGCCRSSSGLVPGVLIGTLMVTQVRPGLVEAGHLHAPAAADSAPGGGLPPADPFGTGDRLAVRHRCRPALFADDDLRPAARADAEQSGICQTRVPRGARLRAAGRIVVHRRCVRFRRALHARQSGARAPIVPSVADRRADRGAG